MEIWDDDNRKLLAALDRDARLSYAEIARSTNINQQKVRYRLHALEELGLFAARSAAIPITFLGFLSYKLHFRVGRASPSEIDRMVSFLAGLPSVVWMAQYEGAYNLALVLRVKSPKELGSFLEEFYVQYGRYLFSKQLTVNVASEYLLRGYVQGKKNKKPTLLRKEAVTGAHFPDAVDCIILEHLSQDCRVPARVIAESITASDRYEGSFTPEGVLHRIKKLESDQLIVGYKVYLNPTVSERLHYTLLFWFDYSSVNNVNEFEEFCRKIPQAVHIARSVGDWDFELSLEVRDVQQYREVIASITKEYSTLVQDYSTLLTNKFSKINFADGLTSALGDRQTQGLRGDLL